LHRGVRDFAHTIVAGIRLHESPQDSRLKVGGVDDKPWRIGQGLNRRASEYVPSISGRNPSAGAAGEEHPEHDGGEVYRATRKRADRRDHLSVERAAPTPAASKRNARHLRPRSPATIDPAETLEIRASCGRSPNSLIRQRSE